MAPSTTRESRPKGMHPEATSCQAHFFPQVCLHLQYVDTDSSFHLGLPQGLEATASGTQLPQRVNGVLKAVLHFIRSCKEIMLLLPSFSRRQQMDQELRRRECLHSSWVNSEVSWAVTAAPWQWRISGYQERGKCSPQVDHGHGRHDHDANDLVDKLIRKPDHCLLVLMSSKQNNLLRSP